MRVQLRRARAAPAAGAALVAGVAGIAIHSPMAQAADPIEYVALGDSSVSGSGVPIQEDLVCTRSGVSWPRTVAAKVGATLTNVNCGGATVADFSSKQFGFVAPQYDALTPGTDLVTLTIGGNDVELVQTAVGCLNPFPEPFGVSCKDRLTAGGVDQVGNAIEAWAPRLGAALDEIHRRSPARR